MMTHNKIYSFLLVCAFSLFASISAFADGEESIIKNNKTADYNYTTRTGIITLDSYVTGYVKEVRTAVPGDVILVLDYSSSMDYNKKGTTGGDETRGKMVQAAACDFIDQMATSANNNNVNHRIAIVTFGTGAHIKSDFLSVKGNTTNVATLKGIINEPDPAPGEGATRYDLALLLAKNLVDGGYQYSDIRANENTNAVKVSTTYSSTNLNPSLTFNDSYCSKSSLLGLASGSKAFIVFLTDGEPTGSINSGNLGMFNKMGSTSTVDTPGYLDSGDASRYGSSSDWDTTYEFGIANHAINTANYLKNDKEILIYSIQVLSPSNSGKAHMAEDALYAISSKYPSATRYRQRNWGDATTDTTSFYQHITTLEQAKVTAAFTTIASSVERVIGIQYGAETIMNDFINNTYFKLTDAVDPLDPWASIHVYTVKCTGVASDNVTRTFSTAPADTVEKHQSDGITIVVNKAVTASDNDQIIVTGFNYSDNWCGKDEHNVAHGNKLLVKVPFEFTGGDDTPVPGTVNTNDEGSGVYPAKRDTTTGQVIIDPSTGLPEYEDEPEEPYISPTISFCTLKITRFGLDRGESAIYEVTQNGAFVARLSVNGTEDEFVSKTLYGLPGGNYKVTETGWNWAYNKKVWNGSAFVTGDNITQSVTDPNVLVEFKFSGEHKTGTGPEDLHNHDEEYKVNAIDVSDL